MSVKIDQALVSAFIAGGFGLSIAHENAPFEPAGQTPYAEIKVLQNDITAGTLSDTNDTDGVFRVLLNYPINTGAIAAKSKADQIFAVFKIGQRFSYGGVTLTILSNQRQPGIAEDGWYKLVLTMPYRAAIER
jgi:hypothetical protein